MRRWMQLCSLGFAIVAFAWINLDTRPRQMGGLHSTPVWFHDTTVAERFGESLLAIPFAMLAGAVFGALVGAIALMPIDALRWIRGRLHRINRNPPP